MCLAVVCVEDGLSQIQSHMVRKLLHLQGKTLKSFVVGLVMLGAKWKRRLPCMHAENLSQVARKPQMFCCLLKTYIAS